MSCGDHWLATFWALLGREVVCALEEFVLSPLDVFAVWAHIVRRKRIDLSDVCHRGSERRTNGTTASDKEAIVGSLLNKEVSDVIGNSVTVTDNTIKLLSQTVFDDCLWASFWIVGFPINSVSIFQICPANLL